MQIAGINPFLNVSADLVARIRPGWRRPLPVLVRVNGEPKQKPWRINLMPIGNGEFRLYLHGDVRKASQTKVGDRVRVDLQFDEAYRNGPMHPMPNWFRGPLKKNEKARLVWEALSPSRQKEILRYFAGLKSSEARARNLERALRALSGHHGRFMGRSW
jgi:hypothetical protein